MRSQKEVCPGDEIADPSRMNVFAVERWTPLKVVYLLILCLVSNRRRWFCSESCVRVWSACGAGTGRDPVFLADLG